jgi:hypothetical protein
MSRKAHLLIDREKRQAGAAIVELPGEPGILPYRESFRGVLITSSPYLRRVR